MNTNINKGLGRITQTWRRHGHFVGAMLCGLLFGSLFGSFVDLNQAAFPEDVLVTESREIMSKAPEFFAESVRFSISLDSLLSKRFTLRAPVSIVKKGEPRSAFIEVNAIASSSPSTQSTSVSLSSPALRVRVRLPKIEEKKIVPTVSTQSAPVVPSISSSVASSAAPAVAVQELSQTEPPDQGDENFPAFGRTLHPVTQVPDWGKMTTPAEWNRTYGEMTDADFVPIPKYDLSKLTIPMATLMADREANTATITAKLYYSTRYMGKYDLDAGEHSGEHPGVDLKLALKTLIGSVAGGRVYAIRSNDVLGKHIIIEHRLNGQQFFSIYGHLDSYTVAVGDAVKAGQGIGRVGMTGKTAAPHLHLEVNRGFYPDSMVNMHAAAGSGEGSINPITFITTGGKGG